jgi:hypothetical protein
MRLVTGTSLFVTVNVPKLTLAEFRHAGGRAWHLHEIAGVENESVEEAERTPMIAALESAGLVVLQKDPVEAFVFLCDDFPVYYHDSESFDSLDSDEVTA